MRQVFIILAFTLLLSSCGSTYFYSTISTLNEDSAQTEDGDFITEDDSLLVAYWFNGRNAPIYINIYNKSETPLHVDWSKSALIADGKAISYRNKIFNLSEDNYEGRYQQSIIINDNEYYINSSFENDSEEISFIPPHSRVTFSTAYLSDFNYDNLSSKAFSNAKMVDKDGNLYKVKQVKFTEENSPLRFRSYLSFYKNQKELFSREQEFYISNLIKSKDLTPKNMQDNLFTRGDLFYIEKESKNKGFGEAFLGTTLILGLFVLDAAISSEYYDE